MANDVRVIFDEDEEKIYTYIRGKEGPLNKIELVDLFGIALLFGKKEGKRTKLVKESKKMIRGTTLDATNIRYLMKAIAIDEEDKIDVVHTTCYKNANDLENDSKQPPFICSRFDGCCYKKAKSTKPNDSVVCSRYLFIAHEYAKTGIMILKDLYDDLGDDILDEMEFELLEFFDSNIKTDN